MERIGRGKDVFDDALAEHGLREAQMLRTRNSYLSVIGVVSPMIGLLGTVIGMMKAFTVLGGSGISDPRALASSIGEVLLATASGLFIAIPAFVSLLRFPQPRADGHRQRRGPPQLAGRRRAFRGTARACASAKTSARARARCADGRRELAPGFDGADDELPGVQRADQPRPEPLPALRRDPGLEAITRHSVFRP